MFSNLFVVWYVPSNNPRRLCNDKTNSNY